MTPTPATIRFARYTDFMSQKLRGIIILLVLVLPSLARADFPNERPYPAITYHSEIRKNPAMKLYWVEVDLTDPHVGIRVSPGGADPDGEGKYQTTLMPTSAIAQRERFDVAVNGDFFQSLKSENGIAIPGYRVNQWALVDGPAATDGKAWSKSNRNHPCLVVHRGGKVAIESVDHVPADAQQVVAGNVMLVVDGAAVKHDTAIRHPRTAIGIDQKAAKLVLLIVDGRQPEASVGMSYAELSAEFLRLGCYSAINLDGGGSTSLVMREPGTDAWRILNKPSDGKERPVANVLGVRIRPLVGETAPNGNN